MKIKVPDCVKITDYDGKYIWVPKTFRVSGKLPGTELWHRAPPGSGMVQAHEFRCGKRSGWLWPN